ncbi:MAG TPA: alpha/beta hydrolase-fold protein, partial [Chitinophagaceae bacterium]|nr:alpha/beta hydrolase-fold protein [Chitinophagaceae bacterium]
MRKLFAVIIALTLSTVVKAQVARIEIKNIPVSNHASGVIYAAGSFNNWNPKDEKFKFQKDDTGNYFIELKLANGNYEYKITRGGWDKVECKKGGAEIANRVLKVESDITIQITVEEWADNIPAKPKRSTASKNVKIIDTAFHIPQLNRMRRVLIYLPDNYATSGKRYPVMYLHDGQNVFDDATSYAGEWGIDEYLDSTKASQCIVVAIDNGGNKRMNEYCTYDFTL